MTPPRKRNKENQGLPKRWQFRHGAYYYQVPPGLEHMWDGYKLFPLGKVLSKAYEKFSQRMENPEEITLMDELIDRYRSEITPTKSPSTHKAEHLYLNRLRAVFVGASVKAVSTQDIYKLNDTIVRKRGATTANRTMELLSNLFTKAVRWGVRSDHPMRGGKFEKNKIVVKRHVPELWEIELALPVANKMLQLYVELKLMTAIRMTDLLSLKITDIREDGIYVMPSKTQDSSGKHAIYEWDQHGQLKRVINEIRRLPRPISSMYLFCTRKGQPYIKDDKSCTAFSSMWQRWQAKAIKETALERKFAEKYIRNRVSSEMDSLESASKLLQHTNTSTTKKHYRLNPEKLRPVIRKSVL